MLLVEVILKMMLCEKLNLVRIYLLKVNPKSNIRNLVCKSERETQVGSKNLSEKICLNSNSQNFKTQQDIFCKPSSTVQTEANG